MNRPAQNVGRSSVTHEELEAALREHGDQRRAAKALGVSQAWVSRKISEWGITYGKRPRKRGPKSPQVTKEELFEALIKHGTAKAAAKALGLDQGTVGRYMRKWGIPPGKKGVMPEGEEPSSIHHPGRSPKRGRPWHGDRPKVRIRPVRTARGMGTAVRWPSVWPTHEWWEGVPPAAPWPLAAPEMSPGDPRREEHELHGWNPCGNADVRLRAMERAALQGDRDAERKLRIMRAKMSGLAPIDEDEAQFVVAYGLIELRGLHARSTAAWEEAGMLLEMAEADAYDMGEMVDWPTASLRILETCKESALHGVEAMQSVLEWISRERPVGDDERERALAFARRRVELAERFEPRDHVPAWEEGGAVTNADIRRREAERRAAADPKDWQARLAARQEAERVFDPTAVARTLMRADDEGEPVPILVLTGPVVEERLGDVVGVLAEQGRLGALLSRRYPFGDRPLSVAVLADVLNAVRGGVEGVPWPDFLELVRGWLEDSGMDDDRGVTYGNSPVAWVLNSPDWWDEEISEENWPWYGLIRSVEIPSGFYAENLGFQDLLEFADMAGRPAIITGHTSGAIYVDAFDDLSSAEEAWSALEAQHETDLAEIREAAIIDAAREAGLDPQVAVRAVQWCADEDGWDLPYWQEVDEDFVREAVETYQRGVSGSDSGEGESESEGEADEEDT